MRLILPARPLSRSACGRPPKRTRALLRGRWAAMAVALALGACGGSGGDSRDPSAGSPTPPSISGTVSDGVVFDQGNSEGGLNVTVKGSEGTARDTASSGVTSGYQVTLDRLEPPYLLSSVVLDGIRLLAPATEAGTALLTPLTTLLVSWIAGQEPSFYFDEVLPADGGVPAFTQAEVDAAKRVVARYLVRVVGIELDPAVAGEDWVTSSMENAPGDPMFDQIVALNEALAAQDTTLLQLSADVAAQRQRCDAASVAISGSVDAYRFCQKDASSSASGDNRIHTYEFADVEGSTLSVRQTGDVVDRVVYVAVEGRFSCGSASACRGVAVGDRTADDRVPIAFDAVTLAASDKGSVRLDGALSGAGVLPSLPCGNDRLYLIDPAGGPQGICMSEFGSTFYGSAQDYNWGSQDPGQPYYLDLIANGSAVSSIDIWWIDTESGNAVTLYRCEGAACTGVSIGEPHDGVDGFGNPARLRDFTLSDVPLAAVDAEGGLGDTVAMRLTAFLSNSVPSIDYTVDCSTSIEHNEVAFGDDTPSKDVCPPPPSSPDYDNFKTAYSYGGAPDDPAAVDDTVYSYGSDSTGSTFGGDSVAVAIGGDGAVLRVFFRSLDDVRTFSCVADACSGVGVSPLDDQGRRTIGFDGTVLSEDPVRQVPGSGVTATIHGGFVTAPDPNFVPSSAGRRGASAATTGRERRLKSTPDRPGFERR